MIGWASSSPADQLPDPAFVIFLLVRAANRMMRKGPVAPAGPSEVELLTQIRDELKRRP